VGDTRIFVRRLEGPGGEIQKAEKLIGGKISPPLKRREKRGRERITRKGRGGISVDAAYATRG